MKCGNKIKKKVYRRLSLSTAVFFCLVFLWTGCDSFLRPDPKSFSSTNNYYRKPDQFEAAISGAYSQLREQAGISTDAFRYITEVRFDGINRQFDVTLPGVQEQPISEWFATSSNALFRNQWNDIYSTIAQTNIILSRIEGVKFNDKVQKDRIIGEAKFIRALSYWYAVQMWGDIPLVLKEITSPDQAIPEEGRAPVQDIYQQIIADLQVAAAKLPASTTDPGRATSGAANFLMGRTYLLTKDYKKAVDALEKVQQSGQYRLLRDYRSIFDPANENNAESIFELQFGTGIPGQPSMGIINKILPWNARKSIKGVPFVPYTVDGGTYLPSKALIESFEDGDKRYKEGIHWWEHKGNAQYPDVAYRGDSIAVINKFLWPGHINEKHNQEGDDILFRYADVLLSLAEAHWRLGNNAKAVSYVNKVRDRAGLPSLNLANVRKNPLLEGTELASDPLGRAIFNERTVELFGEGHRMFDLLRFGVAFKVATTYAKMRKSRESRIQDVFNIQSYELLLPIHPDEIDASNGIIKQNPGWGK